MKTNPRVNLYRLKSGFIAEDSYLDDPRFVNLYVDAINLYLDQNFDSAFTIATLAYEAAPKDFYPVLIIMGDVRMAQGRVPEAMEYMQKAFDISGGYAVEAATVLATAYESLGNLPKAEYFRHSVEINNRFK